MIAATGSEPDILAGGASRAMISSSSLSRTLVKRCSTSFNRAAASLQGRRVWGAVVCKHACPLLLLSLLLHRALVFSVHMHMKPRCTRTASCSFSSFAKLELLVLAATSASLAAAGTCYWYSVTVPLHAEVTPAPQKATGPPPEAVLCQVRLDFVVNLCCVLVCHSVRKHANAPVTLFLSLVLSLFHSCSAFPSFHTTAPSESACQHQSSVNWCHHSRRIWIPHVPPPLRVY